MTRFNLSGAAIRNSQLTLFILLVVAVAGVVSYMRLGQREDPDYVFRAMIIRTLWPGATAAQVDEQITDRIEKKLQEIPYFRRTTSYSKPGESMVILELRDDAPPKSVQPLWYQVRKKLGDIRHTLPGEVVGPFFNDEFGDVFGTIYAFTGDGFSPAELRDIVEDVRQELLRVPDVQKAELIGVQEEQVHVEISSQTLSRLGIDAQAIATQLQAQNLMAPAGTVQGASHAVPLRVTGQFGSVEEISDLRLAVGGQAIRLGDIASVRRGYAEPPVYTMRHGGRPAIGLAISMTADGDVLRLGRNLDAAMQKMLERLPVGVEFGKVSDQPRIVADAVGLFMRVLFEAVAIVLAISFLSLGLRAGAVVALTIPLVLAGTFATMAWFGIHLHRVSTGALVIALGLLVDDAMIAVEMMSRKIEEGFDKFSAATFAYTSTAFPMLTGTLITIAGFLPIATAKSSTGEYTFSIFAVVGIALILSWIAAVGATPYIGNWLLKEHRGGHEVFDSRFYRRLRALIDACMRHRWLTLAVTTAMLVLGLVGVAATEKQFFPTSDRTELLVELWLPEGSSYRATEEVARRFERNLEGDDGIASYVGYVGNGSPRYYLALEQALFRPNFAQYVILTHDVAARDRLLERLRGVLGEDYPNVRARVYRNPLGPPVAYPVQFRVMGPDPAELKRIGEQVAAVVRADPATIDPHANWGDRAVALRIDVDQDKARAIGLSSAQVARTIGSAVSGVALGAFREDDQLIQVMLRAPESERGDLAGIRDLQVRTATGVSVPLSQVATIVEVMEEPIIWRRSRTPTLTIQADSIQGIQAPDLAARIDRELAEVRAGLPPGYRIEIGGPFEDNQKAQLSIAEGIPLMLALVLGLLMIQLRRFSLVAMVVLTAPLGIIGVAAALLISGRPLGFVAMLGTIALGGMIMRNTVILVDQIRQDLDQGIAPWLAVRESAVRRFRPIALTAAAAVFAMIPLSRDVLWGPMAVSIMGGLIVATALTVLFVPALYVAWYRVRPGDEAV